MEDAAADLQYKNQSNGESPVYDMSRHVAVDPEKLAANKCACMDHHSTEIEYYKILRTQILHKMKAKGWKTVMVTSALPGEGKTLTAINLALTFARAFNQTVLLVDADLKQQAVHRVLSYESDLGLIDHLVDDRPVQDLIVWPGIEKLTIISGGRIIQDSAEFLGSPRMKALAGQMRERYHDRYILYDMPPVLGRADALAFSSMVDGVLMVVRACTTSSADLKAAIDLIPREKFLGYVLNRLPEKS